MPDSTVDKWIEYFHEYNVQQYPTEVQGAIMMAFFAGAESAHLPLEQTPEDEALEAIPLHPENESNVGVRST